MCFNIWFSLQTETALELKTDCLSWSKSDLLFLGSSLEQWSSTYYPKKDGSGCAAKLSKGSSRNEKDTKFPRRITALISWKVWRTSGWKQLIDFRFLLQALGTSRRINSKSMLNCQQMLVFIPSAHVQGAYLVLNSILCDGRYRDSAAKHNAVFIRTWIWASFVRGKTSMLLYLASQIAPVRSFQVFIDPLQASTSCFCYWACTSSGWLRDLSKNYSSVMGILIIVGQIITCYWITRENMFQYR